MNYDMFRHREILCDMMHLEKQRREEIAMQKKKRASEKVKKAVVKLSRKVAEMEANTTCTFTFYQPKEVESVKKLKVLRSCGSFEFDNISDRLFSRW